MGAVVALLPLGEAAVPSYIKQVTLLLHKRMLWLLALVALVVYIQIAQPHKEHLAPDLVKQQLEVVAAVTMAQLEGMVQMAVAEQEITPAALEQHQPRAAGLYMGGMMEVMDKMPITTQPEVAAVQMPLAQHRPVLLRQVAMVV